MPQIRGADSRLFFFSLSSPSFCLVTAQKFLLGCGGRFVEFSLYEKGKAGHVIPAEQNKKKIFSERKYAAASTALQKSHCE